jgi:hypothetical protein
MTVLKLKPINTFKKSNVDYNAISALQAVKIRRLI